MGSVEKRRGPRTELWGAAIERTARRKGVSPRDREWPVTVEENQEWGLSNQVREVFPEKRKAQLCPVMLTGQARWGPRIGL